MFDNILNIIVIIAIIIFLCMGYFKLKYPFWSRQPVFHYHLIHYWIYPQRYNTRIITKKNKFYDYDIEFYNMNNIPVNKKELFIEFIKEHFSPNKYEFYNPTSEAITDNFIKHNDKSFLSLKIYNNEILSCMTSKPLECILDGNKMTINYVDFLCVHTKHRRKKLCRKSNIHSLLPY